MDNKIQIVQVCKDLGCCDVCCLRYLGHKSSNVFEDPHKFIQKYLDESAAPQPDSQPSQSQTLINPSIDTKETTEIDIENKNEDVTMSTDDTNQTSKEMSEDGSPPNKRKKFEICPSCLGILQEHTWPKSFEMVKEALEKKRYDCETYACALSSPNSILIREKAIQLKIREAVPGNDIMLTPLKEAWKWSFGIALAGHIGKTLDSGAVSPLLVTLTLEYPDDFQELESLKPPVPEGRPAKKRVTAVWTRRSVETLLGAVTPALAPAAARAACVAVVCTHAPHYLGARYIKLSRELPQTPWVVNGERMMETSVQEIIFAPLAKAMDMSVEETEHRFKFISAGREDVDVRCLGDGRPFAIEISDPRRQLSAEELQSVCDQIASDERVRIHKLVYITRDDLTTLKKGEETKCKTYEALCIKLANFRRKAEIDADTSPVTVTAADTAAMNSYRNTAAGDEARIAMTQRTPVRVLHRRPLLDRTRLIYTVEADTVEDHPNLFTLVVRTGAGAYVKEWVHGDLRRTAPALPDVLCAPTDLLALDVTSVHLDWPPAR